MTTGLRRLTIARVQFVTMARLLLMAYVLHVQPVNMRQAAVVKYAQVERIKINLHKHPAKTVHQA